MSSGVARPKYAIMEFLQPVPGNKGSMYPDSCFLQVLAVAVAAVVFAACGANESTKSQKSQKSQKSSMKPPHPIPTTANSPRLMLVKARLSSFDPKHHWSDNHAGGHDDGVAPLARFTITTPEAYKGRKFAVLFKYAGVAATSTITGGLGGYYSVSLPVHFLKSDALSLDNTLVRILKVSGPEKTVALRPEPPVTNKELKCTADAQCTLAPVYELRRGGYCSRCGGRALNKTAAAQFRSFYAKFRGKRCPRRKCKRLNKSARCVNGLCKLVGETAKKVRTR